MVIRYAKEASDAHVARNTFEAFDDMENKLGAVYVESSFRPLMSAGRPGLYTLRLSGQPEASYALLGAATAHALMLARESGNRACIRVERGPGEDPLEELLVTMGYTGKSELRRMRVDVVGGPVSVEIPDGLTVVRDYLNDENERAYFLARLNAVLGAQHDAEWLAALRKQPFFTRVLLVDENGVAGEMVTYAEGLTGVIDSFYVHPDWRGRGAARYLMEYARAYWLDCNLKDARVDIWSRLNRAMALAYASRFRPDSVVARYPYMDID